MHLNNSSFVEVYKWNEILNKDFLTLCRPFMEQMNICYICHAIHYNNGKQFNLMTNLPFMAFALEHEYFAAKSDQLCKDIKQLPIGETKMFVRNGVPEDEVQSAFYNFDIWNGISFYKRLEDRVIVWAFCTTRENQNIINTYINSVPIFNKFIQYLNYKFKIIFLNQQSHPLLLSGYNLPNYEPTTNYPLNNFLNNLKISRHYYNKNEYLTEREYMCISNLAKGKTTKGIAKSLKLSSRTVESFIKNVKDKTNIYNKDGLIRLYHLINDKHINYSDVIL